MPTRNLRIGGTDRTGWWAIALLGLVLVSQYGAGWYAVQLSRQSNEAELGDHLADLGRLAAPKLRDAALSLADLALDATWSGVGPGVEEASNTLRRPDLNLYLAELDELHGRPFDDFAARAGLARLVVLNEDGLILHDTSGADRLLQPFEFWRIDQFELERARAGEAVASFAYSTDEDAFKRHYEPITEQVGEDETEVRAILSLAADRAYLANIESLARRLRRVGLIMVALILTVGLIIYRLIERQRRIERRAAEADRLAALGTLAAGFAHELRNPLGIIRAFTEDLDRGLRDRGVDGEAVGACGEIVEEIDRMDRIVGQFLRYSRESGEGPESGRTAVLPAIQSVCSILRPSAEKRGISLRTDVPGADPRADHGYVGVETGRLKQMLMNLVLNAIEASPEGETVRLEVTAAAREVEIRVKDNGPGVAPADASRIFEPFFTKRPGGSGLGLAISRQIAERAGGRLELEKASTDGGSCFLLSLPRAPAPHGVAARAADPKPAPDIKQHASIAKGEP